MDCLDTLALISSFLFFTLVLNSSSYKKIQEEEHSKYWYDKYVEFMTNIMLKI